MGVRAVQEHTHVPDGREINHLESPTHTKKMNQNSLGQPLFLGHSGVRCEPSWLNVQSQQLSGFCPSGAVRADGKKEREEPWEILCWCRRTRMDDRLPPGKEISQCQCWEG